VSARTLIVTESAVAASVIGRGLRAAPVDVIGFISSTRPCADEVARLAPDVVIVDETRMRDDALARIAEVRTTLRRARVILLSTHMDAASLALATTAGIDAAVRRTADGIRVGALVRDVIAGDVFQSFVDVSPDQHDAASPIALTGREVQVLRLVAAGEPNGAIAARLWITEQTVKFHLSNVYRKLGVANRTAASHYAHVNGLLTPRMGDASATELESIPAAA
jgi:DNA-binding NarL/FixJ family response regulator